MRCVALIVGVCMLANCAILAGCSKEETNSLYSNMNNLASNAVYTDSNAETLRKFELCGEGNVFNNYVTVDLGATTTFNTITLSEKTKTVESFDVYVSDNRDDEYHHVYKGDTIEGFRLCYLGDVSARFIRIYVSKNSGKYTLNDIGVYHNKSSEANKLRSVAYVVYNSFTEETDFSNLEAITDIIFFNGVRYDAEGNIYYYDAEGNVADDTYYSSQLAILRSAIGDKPINIIVDIAMPNEPDSSSKSAAYSMMSSYLSSTVDNVIAFVNKHDFDGFDMDYEYPTSLKEWTAYNAFLQAVDKKLGDKILSIATGPWALEFSAETIAAIDQVQLMLYDNFDSRGYHGSFYNCAVTGINATLSVGFTKAQINFGLPFYARPLNGYAFWGNYKHYADRLGKYNNLIDVSLTVKNGIQMNSSLYFNSYQMISDKVAYSIDIGLGGVMIWCYHYDADYSSDLSLFRAIHQTKASKRA